MSDQEVMILVGVAAAASLVKSTLGVGYPIFLLPVLALFMDLADAIVVVAPSNLAMNAVLLWNVRSEAGKSHTLRRFLGWSIGFAIIGSLAVPILPEVVLRLLLIGIVLVFLINRRRSPQFVLSPERVHTFTPAAGALAGLFQGATGVSGPVITPWFLSQGLGRNAFVYSISSAFALAGLAQIIGLAGQGLFTDDLLFPSLLIIPVALAIVPIGLWVRRRVSAQTFEGLVVLLLIGSAVAILVRMF